MKLTQAAKLVIDCFDKEFLPTIKAYTDAFNYVCKLGFESKETNGVSLHHKTYRVCRETLPAQLAISARMKATETLKSVKEITAKGKKASLPQSKQTSIRYDANSYTIFLESRTLSIKTTEGRKKFNLIIPKYFERYLDWKHTSADLFVKGGKVFLHVVFEKEINDIPHSGKYVGIDRGINNLAVTSDNKFFTGKEIKKVSQRYEKLRSSLQAKKHSGKRHFRKVSSKERRFRRDVNHSITKRIVNSLEAGSTIILEKLTGIRNSRLRKAQRKDLNKWNFFQFEQFLAYKAKARGIGIEYVPARYTSQKCSKCGVILKSNRKSQSVYVCSHCGFRLHADLNASRNILQNYLDAISHPSRAAVNPPIAPSPLVEQAPIPLG
jgi:IS605 OrfB family transposase